MKTKAPQPAADGPINLREKFSRFADLWSPKIIADVNDFDVKIAKLKGDFVAHTHAEEDEFFLVLKGRLTLALPDRNVTLSEGEVFVVPKGVEHKPSTTEETHVLLLERKTTQHTGDKKTAQTVTKFGRI